MGDHEKSLKALPVLENEEDYPQWKTDVEIWQKFYTDIPKRKQGPAVYFKLLKKLKDGYVKP